MGTCGGHIAVRQFFPIVDTCLSCEDIADKIVRWCADGDFFASFLRPVFTAIRVQHISDLRSRVALKATPCVEVL